MHGARSGSGNDGSQNEKAMEGLHVVRKFLQYRDLQVVKPLITNCIVPSTNAILRGSEHATVETECPGQTLLAFSCL